MRYKPSRLTVPCGYTPALPSREVLVYGRRCPYGRSPLAAVSRRFSYPLYLLPYPLQYSVKEIYYTLQGEGTHTGRPAVFCRFSGCNLWTGREEDRPSATCQFCDTDFVGTDGPGGGRFESPEQLAAAVAELWPTDTGASVHSAQPAAPLVVCTGGEPLLQVDDALCEAFHAAGFEIAVETNGTQPAPDGLDWVCMSPKAGAELELSGGDELKLVFPQPDLLPEDIEAAGLDFTHYFLQPMDGPNQDENTRRAVEYCLQNPHWQLSLQTHKYIGIE